MITANGWPHSLYRGFPGDHPAVNRSRRLQAVTAACMLVRRAAFEQVGGFDEGFRNGYEDVDLCLRIGEQGGEIRYCHEALVHHLESATRSREAHGEPDDDNLRRLLTRWGGRVEPDDVRTYVADGVLEFHYEGNPHPIGMKIDPALAAVSLQEVDNTLQRLLDMRSRQVFELTEELGRDAPLPPAAQARPGFAFRSDGVRVRDEEPAEDRISAEALRAVDVLEWKIAPLRLHRSGNEPVRVNVLAPSFDTRHIFGGYTAVYQLVKRLRDTHNVRVVAVDDLLAEGDNERVRERINALESVAGALSGVELFGGGDRSRILAVNRGDRFIATTSFTAHVAHLASRELGAPRFLHLIQECDTFTLPNGAYQAVAEAAYRLPQVAAFSSELLREYFAERRLGVYGEGRAAGDRLSCTFENAITDVGELTAEELGSGDPRRLLVYARPQATEARNMFELAVLALRRAVDRRIVPIDTEFTGVGRGGRSAARSRSPTEPGSR